MTLSQELTVDNIVTFVPSPSAAMLTDPCLTWISLPGPAAVALVASAPAWGDPGQLTTLPCCGAEIALTLESRLCVCGG